MTSETHIACSRRAFPRELELAPRALVSVSVVGACLEFCRHIAGTRWLQSSTGLLVELVALLHGIREQLPLRAPEHRAPISLFSGREADSWATLRLHTVELWIAADCVAPEYPARLEAAEKYCEDAWGARSKKPLLKKRAREVKVALGAAAAPAPANTAVASPAPLPAPTPPVAPAHHVVHPAVPQFPGQWTPQQNQAAAHPMPQLLPGYAYGAMMMTAGPVASYPTAPVVELVSDSE